MTALTDSWRAVHVFVMDFPGVSPKLLDPATFTVSVNILLG